MRTLLRGRRINRVKRAGKDITAILQRGRPSFIKNLNGLGMDALIPTAVRMVTDGGKKWMEIGFEVNDENPITGNPVDGWEIDGGYGYLYLEWRRNTTQWEPGKFVAAPVPIETQSGGKIYWSRCINPATAPTATAPILTLESTAETGDSRNQPFTAIEIGASAVSLPNAPYAMPGHAAQLQTDLRAAGYTDATVVATSNVDWRIVLKDLTFGTNQQCRVRFASYLHHIDEELGNGLNCSWLNFQGKKLDDEGNEISTDGFARVVPLPGARYGYPALTPYVHPPIFNRLTPEIPANLYTIGGATAPDPLLMIPSVEYPLAPITGSQTPGTVLTRPTYVWPDPGWASLVIVGTWYKNGVATSEHGTTFSDWVRTDVVTYREVATNEIGASNTNDSSWKRWYVPGQWAAPYATASAGGEDAMIRFLDDPDVPCYTGLTWTKADKNRFHQERAPGAAKRYIFNPANWCYAFRESLSAVSVALEYPYPGNDVPNEGWMAKRGLTAITNQHVAGCAHGPPGLGDSSYPLKVRFLGTDGETYDRLVVGQAACHPPSKIGVNGVLHGGDSWIGTLNEPLPAAVQVVRTIPNDFRTAFSGRPWDSLFISQSVEAESDSRLQPARQKDYYPYNQAGYNPAADHPNYPWRHRTMCTITNYGTGLNYFPWAGDSGMPTFVGLGTELLWSGFTGGGGAGPNAYPVIQDEVSITWEDLANQMIAVADANAIARGGLVSPTGKTITVATVAELTS